MEFFREILSPYSEQIGQIAGMLGFLQLGVLLFLLNNIRKVGTTNGVPAIPFLLVGVMSLLMLKFASIMNDDALYKSNRRMLVIAGGLLVFYYYYTPKQNIPSFWKQFGAATALASILLLYATFENPELVETRIGTIITALQVALVGNPLIRLPVIIKTKSTFGIPFPMVLSGAIVQFTWLLYSVASNNTTTTVQNLILFTISTAVLLLFVVFPSKSPIEESEKK